MKPQMRSAPLNVRSSLLRVLSVLENYENAVQRASTYRQIKAAARGFSLNVAKMMPFTAYVFSQCDSSGSNPGP